MNFRLVTYNVLDGGVGREEFISSALRAARPDVILLQEIGHADFVERLAAELRMQFFVARANLHLARHHDKSYTLDRRNVAILSRWPLKSAIGFSGFPAWNVFLEAQVEYAPERFLDITGVHLRPGSVPYTEFIRAAEVKALVRRIQNRQARYSLVAGDFNSLNKDDLPDFTRFPPTLRRIVRAQLRYFKPFALPRFAAGGFTDCYRTLHPNEPGYTLPPPQPYVRLDYIFANSSLADCLKECSVVETPEAVLHGSDHYPLLADFEVEV